MKQTVNFILAIIGFILFCVFIAKFALTPLYKKYPMLDTLAKIGGVVGSILLLMTILR